MINTTGPDGTRAALLASNPASQGGHEHPDLGAALDAHADLLADHGNRLDALEGPAPAAPQGEASLWVTRFSVSG